MADSVGTIGIDLSLNSAAFKKGVNSIQEQTAQASGKISSGFGKSLNSIQGQAQQVSGKVCSSFKKIAVAAVAAFSVKEITSFGKECIDLGSDLAEVQNVVDVTFTSMSGKVNDFAKSAAESYGLSETMAKRYTGTLGAMAKAFGFSDSEAYKMSTALTGLAGDVASFYNISQDEAYTKLKSVFTGETESLKDLGVVMTQTALDSYAMANGYGKTTKEMTEAEKVALRYAFVQNQLGAAQGDFARTSSSWANQTKILSLQFDSLKASIGQGLINVLNPLLKLLNSVIAKVAEAAQAFSNFTAKIFGQSGGGGNAAAETANALNAASENADGLTDAADASTAGIKKTEQEAKKLQNQLAGFDELNILSQPEEESDDDTAQPQTQAAVTANAPGSADGEKSGGDFVSGFQNTFKDLYKRCGFDKFFTNIQSGIKKVNWGSIGDNCKRIFDNLKPIASSAFKGAEKIGKSSMSTLGKFIGGTVSVAGKSLQTATGGVSKWLERDKTKISKGIDGISADVSRGIDNVGMFFDSTFNTLGGSIDRMRPTMESAIAQFLGGATDLGLSLGTVLSGAFEEASNSLANWATNNEAEIGKFFDNLQFQGADVMNTLGGIMGDIGTTLTSWWTQEGGGREIFANVCDMFTNIGTTFMNIYNDWIMPAWNFIVGLVQSAWDNCLKPIFEQGISFIGKVCDCIATLWNNWLSPIVNWLVDFFGPIFTNVFNAVKGVFDTVFKFIGDIISSIMRTFGGLIDFFTGVFSGDWKKAWNGIKDFFGGIWDGIWGTVKFIVNLIIDGINNLWTGIYNFAKAIVDGIGGIAGAIGSIFGQDWSFKLPDNPPLIPKLASGGLVTAPTLALVGDNRGASAGNPEVVAPLNKLQSMLNVGGESAESGQIVTLLSKIYELLLMFIDGGGNVYEFVAELNGDPIFKETIRQNNIYKKRHGGRSAFEGV